MQFETLAELPGLLWKCYKAAPDFDRLAAIIAATATGFAEAP